MVLNSYLDQAFKRCLAKKHLVEYKQVNLAVQSKVEQVFTPPQGVESFDWIFDLTGTCSTGSAFEP